MADLKKSYPMLTHQRWWALRNRFRASVPPKVTPAYLHTVLGISEKTARDVEIPLLKRMGLIESDGSTTDLARRWRDDEQYAAVCTQIRDAVYPDELLHAVPDPVAEEQAAVRWFMNATGGGEKAGRVMAQSYRLLTEGNPAGGAASAERQRAAAPQKAKRETTSRQSVNRSVRESATPTHVQERSPETMPVGPSRSGGMALHIDVQIHIAADASASQIDQIFASMAKHLYGRDAS